MNHFDENIKNYLSQFRGMPANHFTHALKQISEDKSMVGGVIEIVNQLINEKKKNTITAFFVGTLLGGVLVGGVFWIHSKQVEKKKHEKECQKIIKTLENEITLGNAGINPINGKSCPNSDDVMSYGRFKMVF